MISAAQYFKDRDDDDNQSSTPQKDDAYSKWTKQSDSSWWLVERTKEDASSTTTYAAKAAVQPTKAASSEWLVQLEIYLANNQNDELQRNRHGVTLSAPLRLCPRTLTKTLLTPTPKGPFSIAGLAMGGTESKAMEFYYYNNNKNNNYETPEVPLGYDEFEALARAQEEKKDELQETSTVFFVLELRTNNARRTNWKVLLEEIGLFWKERQQTNNATQQQQQSNTSNQDQPQNNAKQQQQQQSTSAEGIQIKLISSATLIQILEQHKQELSEEDDLSWILDELEEAAPLSLPQSLGDDGSLLLLVSLDPSTAQRGLSDQKIIHNGHFMFKFHKSERTHSPPFSNQLITTDFTIGRQVQVVHHPSSEEEDIQKALQAALFNAERFIPEWKRKQWEDVAAVLIMVLPHPTIPQNIASWLRSPAIRRSDFDPALGNVLLHLPYGEQWCPPYAFYIDSSKTISNTMWRDVRFAHQNIAHMVGNVRANAAYHDKLPIGDASVVNADTLYKLCVDLEAGLLNKHSGGTRTTLRHTAGIERGYLSRMLTALMIERLRCYEDMKKHDMYSIHWKDHTVEIPPPLNPRHNCPRCSPTSRANATPCAYHQAQLHYLEETGKNPMPGKPVPIRTKGQLEKLPMVLWNMLPEDSLVVKITVPGVAEDFPLISVGDLCRLFFRCTLGQQQLSTEVIGEVVDVVVKTEVVTIRLPAPIQRLNGVEVTTSGCFPYLQALAHTKHYYLDAKRFLLVPGRHTTHVATVITDSNRKEVMDRFRFDIRFGFQGGRGFDIIQAVLGDFFARPSTDTPPQTSSLSMAATPYFANHNNKRPTKRELKQLDEAEAMSERHLHRLLAPTKRLLAPGMVRSDEREARASKLRQLLTFVTPINSEQQQAVEDIAYGFHGQAPYIIEGPAGTGKSMCVCEAIVQVLRTYTTKIGIGPKILVCAPSDAACDVIAARLLPHLSPQSLLRVNWWSRKIASVKPELLSSCPMDAVGGSFSIPSMNELKRADVIVCQCFVAECLELAAGPQGRGWTKRHFTHLFIDETSQAMECEALVPMAKVGYACSIILVGDPKQLGPTVRDPVAAKMGLGLSILERLLKLPLYKYGHQCVMTRLVKNYRSNEALLTVPSSLFYGGTLEAMAPTDVTDPFADLGDLGPAGFPLLLCNVHDGLERSKLDTPSFYNMEECNAIVSLAQGLLRCKSKEGVQPLHTGQICVITPFRAQVLALRTVLRATGLGGINVGVVEDFQGQEAKVVLISTVLTREHQRWSSKDCKGDSPGQRLGFLHDPKRFNVAITRAHALCVIVGHADYLEKSGTYWAALMDHIKRNDGVLGEEMDDDYDAGKENEDDLYGVADLLRRVDELQLLGSGVEEDQHDLAYYYSDVAPWKVMLS